MEIKVHLNTTPTRSALEGVFVFVCAIGTLWPFAAMVSYIFFSEASAQVPLWAEGIVIFLILFGLIFCKGHGVLEIFAPTPDDHEQYRYIGGFGARQRTPYLSLLAFNAGIVLWIMTGNNWLSASWFSGTFLMIAGIGIFCYAYPFYNEGDMVKEVSSQ